MRVLALATDAFGGHGGIALYNRDFLTALCSLPVINEVVVVPRLMPNQSEPLPNKLTWITSGLGGKHKYLMALFTILAKDRKFQLIVCAHINLLPIAFIAKVVTGAPLLLEIYGIDAWHPTRNRIANYLVRKCNAVISISTITRDRFLSWARIIPEKIHILPNAIHTDWYGPGQKPNYLLERYGLLDKRVLITVGRLVEKDRFKGFDEILEVLSLLPEDVNYLIVGDGNDRNRLQEKVNELNLTNRVIFAGLIPETEKADHFRMADLYVMPSRGEGFGFVFLEALACGIPCVGSKMDGSREALLDGQLGELVDPNNYQEVLSAISKGLQGTRGNVPEKLNYYSYERFVERVRGVVITLLESQAS